MILANTLNGPEGGQAGKAGRLGESPHHRDVQQFTVFRSWHTPLLSLRAMAWSLPYLGFAMAALLQFPWDDSPFGQKLVMLLMASSFSIFGIWMFVVAVATWTNPHKLKFDGNGGLVLQSVVRRRRLAIKNILAVVLVERESNECDDTALCVRIKFSSSKLSLCRFAEREEFLKALKAANPAIVVQIE